MSTTGEPQPTPGHGDGRGGRLYWLLRHVLLGPVLSTVFRPVAEGVDHVPAEGPAIIAANHLSYSDWLFIPLALDRRVTFVAKADYWRGGGLKGWGQRQFFAGTGQIPIDRSGGSVSEEALRAGLRVLARGDLFGIFPGGTRSADGRLYKGRTGVARLAFLSGAPVIPTAVVGTDLVAPPGRILVKVTSPTIRFGAPLDFSRYHGRQDDRVALRAATDEIVGEIQKLSGQVYVDSYAPSRRPEPV